MPVSALVTVTVVPGTTAPCGSLTAPVILPLVLVAGEEEDPVFVSSVAAWYKVPWKSLMPPFVVTLIWTALEPCSAA
jgi:hypothetical protein